jgi:hypothetical protein
MSQTSLKVYSFFLRTFAKINAICLCLSHTQFLKQHMHAAHDGATNIKKEFQKQALAKATLEAAKAAKLAAEARAQRAASAAAAKEAADAAAEAAAAAVGMVSMTARAVEEEAAEAAEAAEALTTATHAFLHATQTADAADTDMAKAVNVTKSPSKATAKRGRVPLKKAFHQNQLTKGFSECLIKAIWNTELQESL